MSQLTLDLHHSLGKDEVIRRTKAEIEKLRSSVANLQDQWEENVLNFSAEVMGMKISGSLEIEEAVVHIKVDLPMAAFMFKGMIEKRIREEVGGLLE